MKIEKLSITNVASIAKAELDFDKELANDSIFLICGDTGAGKSTILDAICMALYCRTPKTSDNINSLLSTGQNDGSVELTFCEKQVRYVSTVTLHKTRTGTFSTPKASLVNLNTGATEAVNKSELEKRVGEILGLGYEQFVRTTMLAQGEFAKFLMSDANEKRGILEKLTNSGIYVKIAKVIGEKANRLSNDMKAIAEKRKAFAEKVISEPEELKVVTDSLAQAKEDKSVLGNRKELVMKQMQWWREYDKTVANRSALRKEADDISLKVNAPDHVAKVKQAELYRKSEALRGAMKSLASAQQKIEDCNALTQNLRLRFQSMLFDLDAAVGREQSLKNDLRKANDDKNRLAPHREILESYAKISAQLGVLDKNRSDFAARCNDLERLAVEVTDCSKALNQRQAELDKRDGLLQTAKAECERLTKAIADANESELNSNNLKLTNAQNVLERYWTKNDELKKSQVDLEQNVQSIERLKSELVKRQEVLAVKESALQKAEVQLETVNDLASDAAESLRAKLKDGCECPVCGSREHYFRADEVFAGKLAQTKLGRDHAKAERDKAMQDVSDVSAKLESAEKERIKLTDEVKNGSLVLANIKSDYDAKLTYASLDPLADRGSLEQAIKQKSDDVSLRLAKVAELRKALLVAQDAQAAAQKAADGANEQKSKADKAVEAAKIRVQEAESNKQKLTQSICDNVSLISGLMQGDETWLAKRDADPVGFDAQLKADAELWKKTSEDIVSLSGKLEIAKDFLAECRIYEAEIRKIDGFGHIVAGQVGSGQSKNLASIMGILHRDIVDNVKNLNEAKLTQASARQEMEGEMVKLAIDNAQAASLASIGVADVEAFESQHVELTRQLEKISGQIAQCDKDLEDKAKSEFRTDETLTLDQMQQNIDLWESKIKSAEDDIVKLSTRLNNHLENERRVADIDAQSNTLREEYDKWATLNANFGSGKGTNISRIALSYVFRHMLKMANVRLQQINNRYELSPQNNKADDLEKMEIEVIDKHCGGARRPVRSLSGGEKFMTSLALALGLSGMASSNMKIDTLFIDEGFDTLDPKRLDDVRQTLTNLQQSMGCKVGVISHVAQLEDDIKLHLRVSADPKAGPGVSKVVWER